MHVCFVFSYYYSLKFIRVFNTHFVFRDDGEFRNHCERPRWV